MNGRCHDKKTVLPLSSCHIEKQKTIIKEAKKGEETKEHILQKLDLTVDLFGEIFGTARGGRGSGKPEREAESEGRDMRNQKRSGMIVGGAVHVVVLLILVLVCEGKELQGRGESEGLVEISADSEGKFRDECGRMRIFHGVNVVYKKAPYFPVTTHFHPTLSLSREDFVYMREMGFNIVRLGVMWPGVEPGAPGNYSQEYLDKIMQTVKVMGEEFGIYTVLDFHQDLLSPKLCGEGVPDYVVDVSKKTCRANGMAAVIAHLLGVCKSFYDYGITFDDKGHADSASCLKNNFATYYNTPEVGSAFQNFYDDPKSQESFRMYWKTVATHFANYKYVLGYDLFNEPWAGDLWGNLAWIFPGRADRKNLAPIYDMLSETIRAIDPSKILFYENTQFPDSMGKLIFSNGFKNVPGGDSFKSKSALSYHVYSCARGWKACNKEGDPVEKGQLEYIKHKIDIRQGDIRRVGGGGFLSEFGACGNSPECSREIEYVLNSADHYFGSWAYWQYKYYADPTTQSGESEGLFETSKGMLKEKVKSLARPYATAIGGEPIHMEFVVESRVFTLVFESSAAPTCSGSQSATEIYTSKNYTYPEGFQFECEPKCEFKLPSGEETLIKLFPAPKTTYTCTLSPETQPEAIPTEPSKEEAETLFEELRSGISEASWATTDDM
eukprot:Nk52_evm84s217 gene=Nk52_evmTU84s217